MVWRLNITLGCGTVNYVNNPTDDQRKCGNQYLGPNQPGVTTPDPTAKSSASSATSAAATTAAAQAAPPEDPSTTRLLDYLLAP